MTWGWFYVRPWLNLTFCVFGFPAAHNGARAAGSPAFLLREGAELIQTQPQAQPDIDLDMQLDLELQLLLTAQFQLI